MKILSTKIALGIATVIGIISLSQLPHPKHTPATDPPLTPAPTVQQTAPSHTLELPTIQPTPTSGKISAVGLVIPKTETEQDAQIDQNTIKNIEQDSRLDQHDQDLSNLQNIIKAPLPLPQPIPTPMTEPTSQAQIEIISPMPNKGLGRDYLARAEVLDEANYVSIGAILYNPDGSINETAEMTIISSDKDQDKVLDGTGDVWGGRYVDGQKQPVHYYAFTYNFKTPGDHEITFSANGLTKTITINVPTEDQR